MRKLFALFAFTVCAATSAFAQFDTATVLGTVRDKTGGVIAGAKVTLTNNQTNIAATQTTNEEGNYEFFTVRIGTYQVQAEKTGFSAAKASNVSAQVGARQRVDLEMSVGQVAEAVEVTGAAPLVETESSQRGQVIKNQQAVELPLNGRQYSSLVLLTTGVRQSQLSTGSASTVREGSFNVNGLRSTFNNFMLDGIDNNAYGTSNQGFSNQVIQPPPDSVAEFQVVTNNESAEYGRSSGATINVAYASGTNRFHGSAWEFVRNTEFNANDFFSNRIGRTRQPFKRNQFGATFGGPIVKDRAFFFVDYEGFRQVRNNLAFSTIPTGAYRQGVFPVAVTNPRTGIVYPANTPIPQSAVNSLAQQVLTGLPAPNLPGLANNYVESQRFSDFTDKYNAKFDYLLTSKLNGFVRLGQRKANIYDASPISGPIPAPSNGRTRVLNQQLATALVYSPTANQLVEFRFGVSRTQAGKAPLGLGIDTARTLYGITGLPSDPQVAGSLPSQLIAGYSDLGRQSTSPQWQYPTVYNPKLNYSRFQGRHSIKAGYEFQYVQTEVQDVNPLYGRDAYQGQFSRTDASQNNPQVYNLADFLFGNRVQYALTNFFIANYRQRLNFLYVQDDWKVSRKLTLNLGLRYEYATPQWEADNKLTNFDPVTLKMEQAKAGGIYDRALVNPDRNNFAPRFGFAYAFDPRTVARGGYGWSYQHFNRSGGGNLLAINGPQVINAVVTQTNPLDPNFRTTQQGYPEGLTSPERFNPLAANVTYMPRDTRTAYVQSWFLSVQREILPNTLLDIAYVGNKGNKLLIFADYNQALPNRPGQIATLQARRPIQSYSDVTYAFPGGFSTYNALQVRLEKRYSHGLYLLNSFTYSKAIDNGSGGLEGPNGNFSAPQNFYNLRAEKGASGYDQTFALTTSAVFEVPFGKGRRFGNDWNRGVDLLLGGWQLGFINTARSGQPINLTYTPSANLTVSGIAADWRGAPNYRPNVTGDPLTPESQRTLNNYLNPATVVVPNDPSQPFGNAGRNIVRSHAFYQLDASLAKNFALTEQVKLQFRGEAFNLWNQTNFAPANGNRSSGAFGSITSTYDPRQLQLALRLSF